MRIAPHADRPDAPLAVLVPGETCCLTVQPVESTHHKVASPPDTLHR
ncbi:hypothetical protein [Rhodococcus sp. H-CA8f]|nr:hypothetical protein [Rhodococcus sp. H-CA8f]